MKIINDEQIKFLLEVLYSTNISAKNFDTVVKMLNELPNSPVTTEQVAEENKKEEAKESIDN